MGTKAKSAFDKNTKRASYFLDIHANTQTGAGAPTLARRELPRGAVVFAVGALDAYLSDVAGEVLVAQFEQGQIDGNARDILGRLTKDIPTLAIEVALGATQADRFLAVKRAIVDYFDQQAVNHGAKAVNTTIGRMGAATNPVWQRLDAKGLHDAAGQLDMWTDIRHRVVHRGEKPRVRRHEGRECVALIRAIADEVDRVAADYANV